MTIFDETLHPRAKTGEFAEKQHSVPEATLASAPQPGDALRTFDEQAEQAWAAVYALRQRIPSVIDSIIDERAPHVTEVRFDIDDETPFVSDLYDGDGAYIDEADKLGIIPDIESVVRSVVSSSDDMDELPGVTRDDATGEYTMQVGRAAKVQAATELARSFDPDAVELRFTADPRESDGRHVLWPSAAHKSDGSFSMMNDSQMFRVMELLKDDRDPRVGLVPTSERMYALRLDI